MPCTRCNNIYPGRALETPPSAEYINSSESCCNFSLYADTELFSYTDSDLTLEFSGRVFWSFNHLNFSLRPSSGRQIQGKNGK